MRMRQCDTCGGIGKVYIFHTFTSIDEHKCPTCHGRGEVPCNDPTNFDFRRIEEQIKSATSQTRQGLDRLGFPDPRAKPPKDWWASNDIISVQNIPPLVRDTLSKWIDQIMRDLVSQAGMSDYIQGAPYIGHPPQELIFDKELRGQLALCLSNISNDYLPTTELNTLAIGVLTENKSEFLIGLKDQETLFFQDWRCRVGRQWKGWGSISKEVAKIWLDESKGVICARFPYKPEVIEQIRLKVPKGKKNWNPDDKVWEFSVETVEVVVGILTQFYEEVIDLTQAPPPSMPSSLDPLLSLLDQDDIQKIQRMLSLKYHPDRGGDPDKMARINEIINKAKGR